MKIIVCGKGGCGKSTITTRVLCTKRWCETYGQRENPRGE